jgi:hypothetical protein
VGSIDGFCASSSQHAIVSTNGGLTASWQTETADLRRCCRFCRRCVGFFWQARWSTGCASDLLPI